MVLSLPAIGDDPHSRADGRDAPHDPKLDNIESQFRPHNPNIYPRRVIRNRKIQAGYEAERNCPCDGEDIRKDEAGDLRRRITAILFWNAVVWHSFSRLGFVSLEDENDDMVHDRQSRDDGVRQP